MENTHAVWMLGEPGIGKTRLAAEVAGRAHRDGALVLYGRCDEQVPAPFQPFIDALRWLVGRQLDDDLRAALGADPEPLLRLAPELHARFPDFRMPDTATETEQYRMFESVRRWLQALSAHRPVVFVIDDVHWADRPTIVLLGHIIRSAEPAQLTILATARNTDPDVSDPLSELVDELERSGRSVRMELRGLSAADIVGLVDASLATPTDAARLAEQLAGDTAGNPLFVGALLAGAQPDGTLPSEVPTDVRAAVRRRVGRLDPGVQEILQFAALSGLEFALGVASTAAGLDNDEGLARVEQAVSAALVEEMDVDRFRFTHALVRDALERELSASRAARMHATIAAAIETCNASRLDPYFRALAQHYAAVGTPEMLERAIDYACRSARRAVDIVAFAAGVADYAFALELAGRIAGYPESARYELLMAKGEAEFFGGMHRPALRTLHDAADVARAIGDWSAFTRTALLYEEANWRPGLPGSESVALLRQAEPHQTDPKPALKVQAALARALHFSGDPNAKVFAQEVVAAARKLGDAQALTLALAASVQTLAGYEAGDIDLVLTQADEVVKLVTEEGDVRVIQVAQYALNAALCRGDRELHAYWFRRLAHAADQGGLRFDHYITMCDRQVLAFIDGDLVAAEDLANECLAFGKELGEDVTGPHGVQMFFIRREQGRLGELEPIVRMLLKVNPTEAMWGPGLVLLLAEIGLHEQGIELLERLTRDNAAAVPRDMLFPAALCMLAEAALVMGRAEPVEVLERLLQPWASGGVPLGGTVSFVGAATRYLALLAWLSDRPALAEARFAEALTFSRRLDSPVWIAHTLADWAGFRIARGDGNGSRPLLAEAAAIAARHDLVAIAERVRGLGAGMDTSLSAGSAADEGPDAP